MPEIDIEHRFQTFNNEAQGPIIRIIVVGSISQTVCQHYSILNGDIKLLF
jgi:hypothetical protein